MLVLDRNRGIASVHRPHLLVLCQAATPAGMLQRVGGGGRGGETAVILVAPLALDVT